METQTPQFNRAINDYFADLKLDEKGGQWRNCRFSGEQFYVRPEDVEFYKKAKVPLPTLSPKERIRRKLAFSNSYNLFKGVSAFSGKPFVAEYPPNTAFKLYEHQVWFGEAWDPFDYAREYQPEQGFFGQFKELQIKVPRPNLHVDTSNINSDYTNNAYRLKNCYLVFDSKEVEDSAHSITIDNSRNCFDCAATFNSDMCFDCFESSHLHKCFFVEHSRYCLESFFLFDCRDCDHCFMCANLRHKKYCFFNQQFTKELYEEKIKKLNLGNREILYFLKEKFFILKSRAVYKQNHNDWAVNSFGDYIKLSRNCFACFYSWGSENLAYSAGNAKVKNSYDVFGGLGSESCYDSYAGIACFGLKFSLSNRFSQDLEYCDSCSNCHNCFGCIGLKNKSYCILNKQYLEEQYWQKLDEIKTLMFQRGEYGEFFPPKLAPIPYNISLATSYKGYDDIETALRYGYLIEQIPEMPREEETGEIIQNSSLPKDIKNVKDDILDKTIFDVQNKKKFRYIKKELDFYRRHNLPLSLEHPSIRLAENRKKLETIVLEFFQRNCAKCGKEMQSVYPQQDPRVVYCEACYLAEVV